MKKPVNKAKSSKSVKKQKPLKTTTTTSSTKKVYAKKQVKKPSQKNKPAVRKIKPIATVTIKNIKAENTRLTNQLKQKNRELEIEAVLERIRSRSMTMQKSIELVEVVHLLNDEIAGLAIKVDNTSILTDFSEKEKGLNIWIAVRGRHYLEKFHVPFNDSHPISKRSFDARSKGLDYFTEKYNKVEKNRYFRWLYKYSDYKKIPEDRQQFTLNAPGWTRTHIVSKNSVLIFQRFRLEEFTDEENIIFKRLGKVFEQTYTRFLDLQKAEAQARESQIEAALEKVRSRSLAMHKSDELQEVINTVFDRIKDLEIETGTASIVIYKEGSKEMEQWVQNVERTYSSRVLTPLYEKSTIGKDLLDSISGGKDLLSKRYTKEEKNEWFGYLFEHSDFKHIPDARKKYVLESESYCISIAAIKSGAVGLARYSDKVFSDLENDILKRFAKVFEQAYIRFLDLQKAEAQAREAKIEAALERVRSSSMAMHQSSDLHNVIKVVTDQLCALEIKFDVANFAKVDDKGNWDLWISTPDQSYPAQLFVPYLDHPIFNTDLGFRDKNGFYSEVHGFEEKNRFFKHFFENTEARHIPETRKQSVFDRKGFARALFSLKNIRFSISNYDGIPFTEDETSIFRRFAGVFEQSYTRFLDLQKAEAQARDAQIEAALEKVRSSSLAMHRSDELQGVVNTVIEKLNDLNIELDAANILIFNREDKSIEYWTGSNSIGSITTGWSVPYADFDYFKNIHTASEAGQELFTATYPMAEKNEMFNHLFANSGFNELNAERKKFIMESSRATFLVALVKDIGIQIVSYSRESYFSNEIEILKRFARVFNQAYTRFLDLQKAEAQTRDAQIETALERIRARTMAMHKSEELSEAATLLYQQLGTLGVHQFFSCGYIIIDEDKKYQYGWMTNFEGSFLNRFTLPLTGEDAFDKRYESWKKKDPVFHQSVGGENLQRHFEFAMPHLANKEVEEVIRTQMPDPTIFYCFNFSSGYLHLISDKLINKDQEYLLTRFTNVFEMTYKRFLDLKKAEAQMREAQIESSLEKVRSKTMAMHNSQDVGDTVATMFEQLVLLGITTNRCGILIFSNTTDTEVWTAKSNLTGEAALIIGHLDVMIHPMLQGVRHAWENKDSFFSYELKDEDLIVYYKSISNYPGYPTRFNPDSLPTKEIHSDFFFPEGCVFAFTNEIISEEAAIIFKRFANVFGQTYRRYLDLQKAESQARQAQIETSMEKVRARALAMQKPDELIEVAQVLRKEMGSLGVEELETSSIYIHNEISGYTECWYAIKKIQDDEKKLVTDHMIIKLQDTWVGRQMLEFYHSDKKQISIPMQGDNRKEWMIYCANHSKALDGFYGENIPDRTYHLNKFSNGYIGAASPGDISPESWELLQRATTVFSLAYTRFSDLQNAEAQAKEAKIELALERIRARTMAMHKSEELGEAAVLLYKELKSLGVTHFLNCGYVEIDEPNNIQHGWMTKTDGTILEGYTIPLIGDAVLQLRYDAWKSKEPVFYQVVGGHELKRHTEFTSPHLGSKEVDEMVRLQFPDPTIYYCGNFSHGYLHVITGTPLPSEEESVLARFARVFEMTYKRFLDLQKAETQARQAQIETAMEKVRARALAMQKPEELKEVAQVLRREMGFLGVEALEGSTIFIHSENTDTADCWFAIKDEKQNEKPIFADYIPLPLNTTWVGRKMLEFFNSSEKQISIPMIGAHRREWIEYCYQHSPLFDGYYGEHIPDRIYHLFKFSNGAIGAAAPGEISAESWELLQRATAVFSLAYTRFSDLQHAEAQTKEAIKRASVDRVRAEIASMRTTADLEKITPVVWNELTTLGVPFIRCGVFIMDEEEQQIHSFLSTPDGKAIAAFNTPFDNPGALTEALPYWRKKEIYKTHWDEAQFLEQARTLIQQGAISSPEKYLTEHRPTSLYLHFLPFLQGMLYVGSETSLTDEELQLVQNLAVAFSTAYARYEDFNKLEEAKSKIETTLSDLKSTQSQLVQAEKMASLGELTAGIAHEIQNPLNFVNNFASINAELIDEMREELAIGNSQLAIDLSKDIKENELKIMHHGKRAESIVKGMLQHSRTSTGTKEPTNINALADEYMRLSYHGLRAKDKSFNAEFKMDLDPTLPLIYVIPQDIGRVLLNLFNNAFWACAERGRLEIANRKSEISFSHLPSPISDLPFSPTVTLTTKNIGDQSDSHRIEIHIADNGPGIPSHIIDKIFQPFFTTKPTGQGTGLGLSLAYDIIKAHNGNLKVETQECEGAAFIIDLPIK